MERVSNAWTADLDQPFPHPQSNGNTSNGEPNGESGEAFHDQEEDDDDPQGSTVRLYELSVQDPTMDALQLAGRDTHSTELEVKSEDTQAFLGKQLKQLETFKKQHDETFGQDFGSSRNKPFKKIEEDEGALDPYTRPTEAKVLEHIGPVQFNMGGIQVDADDMVQRLKVSTPVKILNSNHTTGD